MQPGLPHARVRALTPYSLRVSGGTVFFQAMPSQTHTRAQSPHSMVVRPPF